MIDFSQLVKDFKEIPMLDIERLEKFQGRLSTFYREGGRHNYSEISNIIYNTEDDQDNEIFAHHAEWLVQIATDNNDESKEKFDKFLDHINLAIQQKEYIKSRVERFETKNELLQDVVERTQDRVDGYLSHLKVAREKMDKLEENKSKIYSEFIVILGIFSAIIFASFGGLEILKNVLGNIQEVETAKLLVFSSFTVAAIITLLFVLFSGIAKLTGKNIRSCGCEGHKANCSHSVFTKHPSIIVSNFVLLYVATIGAFGYIVEYKKFIDFNNILLLFDDGRKVAFLAHLILTPIIMGALFHFNKQKDAKRTTKRHRFHIDQILP